MSQISLLSIDKASYSNRNLNMNMNSKEYQDYLDQLLEDFENDLQENEESNEEQTTTPLSFQQQQHSVNSSTPALSDDEEEEEEEEDFVPRVLDSNQNQNQDLLDSDLESELNQSFQLPEENGLRNEDTEQDVVDDQPFPSLPSAFLPSSLFAGEAPTNTSSSSSEYDSNSMTAEIERLINANIGRFITKNSQFGLGYGDDASMRVFARADHTQSINTFPPNVVPIYHALSFVIPKNSLPGTCWGEFNHHDKYSVYDARLLGFFIKAFCNPMIGEDPANPKPTEPARASFETRRPDLGRTTQKVHPMVEILYHNIKKVFINDLGLPDDEELTIKELFQEENVAGVRFWFFIADPSINPFLAVAAAIKTQNEERGNALPFIVPENSDRRTLELVRSYMPEDALDSEIEKQAEKITKGARSKATRRNFNLAKTAEKFTKEKKQINDQFVLLPYDITSLTKFYEVGIRHIKRCLDCTNVTCTPCTRKDAIYDKTLILVDQDGNPVPMVPTEIASYPPLKDADPIAIELDELTQPTPNIRHAIYITDRLINLVDPTRFMEYGSVQELKILEAMNVCEEQMDPQKYILQHTVGNETYDFYVFPSMNTVCSYRSMNIYDLKIFSKMKLPWKFSTLELVASAAQVVVKKNKQAKSVEIDNQTFSKASRSIDTQKDLRKLILQREAAKTFLPPESSNKLYGPNLEKGDFEGILTLTNLPDRVNSEQALPHTVLPENKMFVAIQHTHKILRNLGLSIPFLDKDATRFVLKEIQKNGMIQLKQIFLENVETTSTVQDAAKLLNHLTRNSVTAFQEIPIVPFNLASYTANLMVHIFFLAESRGILHTHEYFYYLLIAAFRSCHCQFSDELHGFPLICPNIILLGDPAAGKSYIVRLVLSVILAHSFSRNSSLSATVRNNPKQIEEISVFDEISNDLDPGRAQSDIDKKKIEQIKELLTSHMLYHAFMQASSEEGKQLSGKERIVWTIHSFIHSVHILCGNDWYGNENELSYNSRFFFYHLSTNQTRYGAVDMNTQALSKPSNTVMEVISQPDQANDFKTTHAIIVLYCKGVSLGAVPAPNIKMAVLHFTNMYDALVQYIPSIKSQRRVMEIFISECLSWAVWNATYLVFNSLISPLITFDETTKTIQAAPFRVEQINYMQPYVFLPEDFAIAQSIATFLRNSYIPKYYQAIKKVAEMFCHYDPNNPGRWVLAETRSAEYAPCVNPNYLRTLVKGREVIKAIVAMGYNVSSARCILNFLAKLTINARYIDPRAHAEALSTAEPVTFTNTTLKAVQPAIVMFNASNATFKSRNELMDECLIEISIEFLQTFTPKYVLDIMTQAAGYCGIRPRKITIPIPIENLPFMPQVIELKKGTHPLKNVASSDIEDFITASMGSKTGLTAESQQSWSAISRKKRQQVGVYTEDAETKICEEWVAEHTIIPPGRQPKDYTPKAINEEIIRCAELFKTNPKSTRINYPTDIQNKFTAPQTEQQRRVYQRCGALDEIEGINDEELEAYLDNRDHDREIYEAGIFSKDLREVQNASLNTSSATDEENQGDDEDASSSSFSPSYRSSSLKKKTKKILSKNTTAASATLGIDLLSQHSQEAYTNSSASNSSQSSNDDEEEEKGRGGGDKTKRSAYHHGDRSLILSSPSLKKSKNNSSNRRKAQFA